MSKINFGKGGLVLARFFQKSRFTPGFSLIEVMIAIFIGVLVIEAAYLFFPIGSRIARQGEAENEISQDGRIILNRLDRELRQTPEILITIPSGRDQGLETIDFTDGFPADSDPEIHYISYQKNNQTIERVTYHFIDPAHPETIVAYNFSGAVKNIENTEVIAENLKTLKIYRDGSLIKIFLTLEKQNKAINLLTGVYPRNVQP